MNNSAFLEFITLDSIFYLYLSNTICQSIPSLSLYVKLFRHYLSMSIYSVIISLFQSTTSLSLSVPIYSLIISLCQSIPSLSLYVNLLRHYLSMSIYSVIISLFQSTPSLSLYVKLFSLYLSMSIYSPPSNLPSPLTLVL